MEINFKTHKNLDVWNESVEFVIDIYNVTKTFPETEQFGLVSQLNRAAVSIPSNIAEGAGRLSKKEFIQFLSIALGSIAEVDTQLLICNKLGYIDDEMYNTLENKLTNIRKMTLGLRKNIYNKL
jgi:four helix bundle protein